MLTGIYARGTSAGLISICGMSTSKASTMKRLVVSGRRRAAGSQSSAAVALAALTNCLRALRSQ